MSKDFKAIAQGVVKGVGALHEASPDVMNAFGALAEAATTSNALDIKTKELMALAVGITTHCDGCVAYHIKEAYQHGASREEVTETIGLAIYMGGGPAAVYGAQALSAFDQFKTP